jgi:glycosyltransferase involved in cell wall biosynthesis
MAIKILFLIPYPLEQSPSQRFRFEQYFTILHEEGILFKSQSFLDVATWKVFFSPDQFLMKAYVLLLGFVRRFSVLFRMKNYDFIFIHREVTPLGPPLFEWIISKVLKKKIIYDFDDAIWLTDRKRESRLLRLIKWRSKVASICRWSYKVSCGNDYLCGFARKYNEAVFCIPTTIDTVGLHNPSFYRKIQRSEVIVGWTGSHSTVKYLQTLEDVLNTLEKKYATMTLWVISDEMPKLQIPRMEFKPWSIGSEVEDLFQFDIGIMPLPDDMWSKGKCGFKALQYMSLGIPAVVSPVGVNSSYVSNGIEGFVASSENEWIKALSELIENPELRIQMGENGRKKVEDYYSVNYNKAFFLSLFEKFEIRIKPSK